MKKSPILFVLSLLLPPLAWGQDTPDELRFKLGAAVTGMATYGAGGSNLPTLVFEGEWVRRVKKRGEFSIGLVATGMKGKMEGHDYSPSEEKVVNKQYTALLTIPVKYRHNILKHFYIEGGGYIDLGGSVNDVPVFLIGPGVGAGFDFLIAKGLHAGIYGNARMTGIIVYPILFQASAGVNVSYRFQLGKKK
jgi:hypothetical protein